MSAPMHKLSLEHRYRPARVPPRERTPDLPARAVHRMPLLVLLHGYGSNEEDLFGLAPYIDPRFAIVSARAPQMLGYGSYAWFPIEFGPDGVLVRPEDVRSAVATAVDFVSQAMAAYGAAPASTILAGFSQGATMAGAALLRQPGLAHGGVLMSGFVTAEMGSAEAATSTDGLRGKPVLITHGRRDPVVPITSGQASRDLFQAFGADVVYREYSMAHEISEACLEDVDAWLSDRIAPSIAPIPD